MFDGEEKGRIELKSQQGWQKPIGWIVVEAFEIRNGFKADNQRSNLEHGIYCTGSDFRIVNNVIHSNSMVTASVKW